VEVLLRTGVLSRVATVAEQLEVGELVAAAVAERDTMVHL
jgi:hypothetical protein